MCVMKTLWTPSPQAYRILRTYTGIHSLRPRNPRYFEWFFEMCSEKWLFIMRWFCLLYDLDGRGALMDKGKKQARSVDTHTCTYFAHRMSVLCLYSHVKTSDWTLINSRIMQKHAETIIWKRKVKKSSVNSTELQTGFSELVLFRFNVKNCISKQHQNMTILLIILRAVKHFSVQPLHTICQVNWPNTVHCFVSALVGQ